MSGINRKKGLFRPSQTPMDSEFRQLTENCCPDPAILGQPLKPTSSTLFDAVGTRNTLKTSLFPPSSPLECLSKPLIEHDREKISPALKDEQVDQSPDVSPKLLPGPDFFVEFLQELVTDFKDLVNRECQQVEKEKNV